MKKKIEVTIQDLRIIVTQKNINIKDSYKIWSSNIMEDILDELEEFLKTNYSDMDTVFNHRSKSSMIREWIAHNNAYTLGYKKERTGSVDLDYPQKWYNEALYFIISFIIL